MWNYLRAIDDLGPADLVVLAPGSDAETAALREALPRWHLRCVPLRRRRISRAGRLVAALRGRIPSDLVLKDIDRAAAEVGADLAPDRPVIAVQAAAAMVALCLGTRRGPLVVDLWDVEDVRLSRELEVRRSTSLRPRTLWHTLRQRSDVRAWRHLHAALCEAADAITVCSDVDRRAMPVSGRVLVVPNGADVEKRSACAPPEPPPVVLFHGQNTYGPNVEAAHVLASEVQPLLRAAIPDVRIRIVGRTDHRVERLHRPPMVTVTGFVEDIGEELDRAWVVIVPLRVGGGTRLKILEAFAHRVPVVSTGVGAEGLAVEHGRHLLIADDPMELAARTAELIRDRDLARRLTGAAFELVRTAYDWRTIRTDLADSLRPVLDGRSRVEHPA